ncbi:MAG: universal stress protein [Planctomycetes bacterium]|nr:universal stress protein [Planctomycetota bacterium]
MSDFKLARILAPTDRSPFSEKAVAYARNMAKQFGAELHVLRVMADEERALAEYAVTGVIDASQPQDDYSRWVAELVGEAGDVRRVEAVQISSDVSDAIVRYAVRQAIDLIVMATHGRTGLMHLLMGSVAEKVVRAAPCPVLTMRPETLSEPRTE